MYYGAVAIGIAALVSLVEPSSCAANDTPTTGTSAISTANSGSSGVAAEATPAKPVAAFDPGETFPGGNEPGREHLVKALQQYPMVLRRPEEKTLCVRVAERPVDLLVSDIWEAGQPDETMIRRHLDELTAVSKTRLAVVHSNEPYRAEIWLILCPTSTEAMRNAIHSSLWLISCQRPNTWGGLNKVIPVDGASFVANFSPGPFNDVMWSGGNLAFIMVPNKESQDHFPSDEELGRLASRFSILAGVPIREAKEATAAQIKVTVEDMAKGTVPLRVETPKEGGLKGWWLRLDTSEGRLTLVSPEKATLSDVPAGGTIVKCYAFSPDGKQSFVTIIHIPTMPTDAKPAASASPANVQSGANVPAIQEPTAEEAVATLSLKLPVQVVEVLMWRDGGSVGVRLADANRKEYPFCLDGHAQHVGPDKEPPLRYVYVGALYAGKPGTAVPIGGEVERALKVLLQTWADQQLVRAKQAEFKLRGDRDYSSLTPEETKLCHILDLIPHLRDRPPVPPVVIKPEEAEAEAIEKAAAEMKVKSEGRLIMEMDRAGIKKIVSRALGKLFPNWVFLEVPYKLSKNPKFTEAVSIPGNNFVVVAVDIKVGRNTIFWNPYAGYELGLFMEARGFKLLTDEDAQNVFEAFCDTSRWTGRGPNIKVSANRWELGQQHFKDGDLFFRVDTNPDGTVQSVGQEGRPAAKSDVQPEPGPAPANDQSGAQPAAPPAPANVKSGAKPPVGNLTPAQEKERDRLLADVDAKLRQGLLVLAEQLPQLRQTNHGSLAEALAKPSLAGEIRIAVGHYNAGGRYSGPPDGSTQPVAEGDSYLFEYVLKPVGGAAEQFKVLEMFPNLGLEGRCDLRAGDVELGDALRKLLTDALASLVALNMMRCDDARLVPLGEKLAKLTTTSTPAEITKICGEGKPGPDIVSSAFSVISVIYPLENGGHVKIITSNGYTSAVYEPVGGSKVGFAQGETIALREADPAKPARPPGATSPLTSVWDVPWSQISLGQALAEKDRLVVLCEALQDGYGPTLATGVVTVDQKYKVLQVLSGESAASEVDVHYHRVPSLGEHRLMTGSRVVWIVRPDAAAPPVQPERWRGLKALPDTPENRKSLNAALAVEKNVAKLLARLGSEVAAERNSAQVALVDLGEPILPFLLSYADRGPAQVRGFLGRIVQDIRLHWGPVVNGLQVGFAHPHRPFVFGQPMLMEWTIQNVGTTDQPIVWFNDAYSPISFVWSSSAPSLSFEPERNVPNLPNSRHWHRGPKDFSKTPAPPAPLVLKPGESKSVLIDLRDLDRGSEEAWKLKPGLWRMAAVYDPQADLNDLKSFLGRPGAGLEHAVVDRINSLPAEIEIVSQELPGSGWTLQKALAENGRLIFVGQALDDGTVENVQMGQVRVTQKYKVVQTLTSQLPSREVKLCYQLHPLLHERGERRILNREQLLWIIRPTLQDTPFDGIKALPDTPENRQALGVAPASAEPALSKLTSERRRKLLATTDSFSLGLNYWGQGLQLLGPQPDSCFQLDLFVKGDPPLAVDLSDPRPNVLRVAISEEQAARIIDFLALRGLLDSDNLVTDNVAMPTGPTYVLTAGNKTWQDQRTNNQEALSLHRKLGWNLSMSTVLQDLRQVLDGEAAKAMDKLLASLQTHRAEWEKAAVPADSKPAALPVPANVPSGAKPAGDKGVAPAAGK